MADRFISDLVGTLKGYFRIAGIRLNNLTDTILEIKNRANSAYLGLKAQTFRARSGGVGDVVIGVNGTAGADIPLNLPSTQGATGTVLQNDGSGNTSWVAVATTSNMVRQDQEVIAFNSGTTTSMFTPPANSTIRSVLVEVETAFNATNANLSVGIGGTPARYMGATENDLSTAGIYEVAPMDEVGGSPVPVIITFAPGTSGSAGSARVTVEYALPA